MARQAKQPNQILISGPRGANGDPLARLSTAQASLVRDTADVSRLATTHLAR